MSSLKSLQKRSGVQPNTTIFHKYGYVFIDDSGTKEYNDISNSPLFCYSGIILQGRNVINIENDLAELKKNFFNGNMPEIKSNWLRNPTERQKRYEKQYNVSEKTIRIFVDCVYDIINNNSIRIIGAVVDKSRMKETYSHPFNPSPLAYELLLQHAANFYNELKRNYNFIKKMVIIIDDMTGKTPSGNEWKSLLVRQHQFLINNGVSPLNKTWKQRDRMDYSMIYEKLTFCDSKLIGLIQLADLCAYNFLRQARDHWDDWDSDNMYNGYKRIKQKIHHNKHTKIINRFGAVAFP